MHKSNTDLDGPDAVGGQYAGQMKWQTEWLLDESQNPALIPAYQFLKGLPVEVRVQLLAFLEAVKTTGPDQWRDRNSHAPMKGNLDNLHEVRDKHGEALYRLFVRWQREESRVVVIDGREKVNKTAISDAEYKAIAALAAKIDEDPPPFASIDDFIRADLGQ